MKLVEDLIASKEWSKLGYLIDYMDRDSEFFIDVAEVLASKKPTAPLLGVATAILIKGGQPALELARYTIKKKSGPRPPRCKRPLCER